MNRKAGSSCVAQLLTFMILHSLNVMQIKKSKLIKIIQKIFSCRFWPAKTLFKFLLRHLHGLILNRVIFVYRKRSSAQAKHETPQKKTQYRKNTFWETKRSNPQLFLIIWYSRNSMTRGNFIINPRWQKSSVLLLFYFCKCVYICGNMRVSFTCVLCVLQLKIERK